MKLELLFALLCAQFGHGNERKCDSIFDCLETETCHYSTKTCGCDDSYNKVGLKCVRSAAGASCSDEGHCAGDGKHLSCNKNTWKCECTAGYYNKYSFCYKNYTVSESLRTNRKCDSMFDCLETETCIYKTKTCGCDDKYHKLGHRCIRSEAGGSCSHEGHCAGNKMLTCNKKDWKCECVAGYHNKFGFCYKTYTTSSAARENRRCDSFFDCLETESCNFKTKTCGCDGSENRVGQRCVRSKAGASCSDEGHCAGNKYRKLTCNKENWKCECITGYYSQYGFCRKQYAEPGICSQCGSASDCAGSGTCDYDAGICKCDKGFHIVNCRCIKSTNGGQCSDTGYCAGEGQRCSDDTKRCECRTGYRSSTRYNSCIAYLKPDSESETESNNDAYWAFIIPALVVVCCCYCWCRKKKRKKREEDPPTPISSYRHNDPLPTISGPGFSDTRVHSGSSQQVTTNFQDAPYHTLETENSHVPTAPPDVDGPPDVDDQPPSYNSLFSTNT